MKITRLNLILCFGLLFFISCKTTDVETDPETCGYKADIAFKWYNDYTVIDTYTDALRKTKLGTTVISPVGFLKIDPNGSYEIVSNDVAEIGNWKIDDKNCKLILDDMAVTSVAIEYDVLNLSANRLVVKRTLGDKVYTQYYKTASCPSNAQLSKQWDNSRTFYFDYNVNTNAFTNPYLIFPVGYFRLNTDLSYNVWSDGVPLNGTWKLGQPYCMLDLDVSRANARSFEVVKLTTDSLVIWRKDAAVAKAYLQYYLKH